MVKQNFGSQKFGLKQNFCQKFLDPKKLWIQKNFWAKFFLVPYNCKSKNLIQQDFGSKKIQLQKVLGPKKFLDHENFWPKKMLGPKNVESEKYLA